MLALQLKGYMRQVNGLLQYASSEKVQAVQCVVCIYQYADLQTQAAFLSQWGSTWGCNGGLAAGHVHMLRLWLQKHKVKAIAQGGHAKLERER